MMSVEPLPALNKCHFFLKNRYDIVIEKLLLENRFRWKRLDTSQMLETLLATLLETLSAIEDESITAGKLSHCRQSFTKFPQDETTSHDSCLIL